MTTILASSHGLLKKLQEGLFRLRPPAAVGEPTMSADVVNGDNRERHEFKYILTRSQARLVQSFMEKIGQKLDAYSKDEPYFVTSLYFDTPMLDDYYDKLAGLKYRRKFRARVHHKDLSPASAPLWLEIKEKHDMVVQKKRTLLPADAWKQFLERDTVNLFKHPAVKSSPLLREFFYHYFMQSYRPTTLIRYRRATYETGHFFPVRVTFDSEIEACKWRHFSYNDPIMTSVAEGTVILEVKFRGSMPWWFGEMVKRFRLSRQAFSKYVTANDTLTRLNPMPR